MGLPPLPKSLSVAAATTLGPGVGGIVTRHGQTQAQMQIHPQMRSQSSSPMQAQPAASANAVAALTSATGDLYLGPSTSSAAMTGNRHRNYNGHGRHGSLSSTQESLSDRESVHSRASSTHSANGAAMQQQKSHTPTPSNDSSSTIDNQLAILRREMYGLRQLDLSLLSQLWALNESIQGFRVFLQEQDALSPPSRSRTPSDANSLSSDEEDGSYAPVGAPKLSTLSAPNVALSSPAASVGLPTKLATGSTTSHTSTSSTSGASGSSSAASSMGKHHQQHQLQQQQHMPHYHHKRSLPPPAPPAQHKAHPQLPRILQQRMRHAPPPPPPTRPKSSGGGASSSSSNHSISSVTQLQQHAQHQRPV
ncbi:CG34441 [Drosophila busckii]|uniref:CG34441 n=2 Tax=Drosophila busckii TaxID=30019 RepID=A0A0M3QT52_DROBS|nr:CG34441 [Drosophila busckii]